MLFCSFLSGPIQFPCLAIFFLRTDFQAYELPKRIPWFQTRPRKEWYEALGAEQNSRS